MTGCTDLPAPFGSFQEAVDFLEKAVNYEKRVSWKYTDKAFDLRRMEELLAQLGDPHRKLRVIHIAGTKGKGSTAALIAACLQAAGYRTGLHTSPHLVSVCERMAVDGRAIEETDFCRLLDVVRVYIQRKRCESRDDAPTYFETTTALAFKHFEQQEVDWAVVEVGLGGRLDSTNVVLPECCVITAIGLDHVDKLGDTPEKIAAEKAGIIKNAVPVILAKQKYPAALQVLRKRADAMGCLCWEVGREITVTQMAPLGLPPEGSGGKVGWHFSVQAPRHHYEHLFTPLLGAHQVDNSAAAIGALEALSEAGKLSIDPEAVTRGIALCKWPARIEVLRRRPALILDGAHTVESVEALLAALETHFPGRTLHFVFGCSADKDYRAMLARIGSRCDGLIATQADSPRAAPSDLLAELARDLGIGSARAVATPPLAVKQALAQASPEDVVCVTGSFFVAGEVRHAWEHEDLA